MNGSANDHSEAGFDSRYARLSDEARVLLDGWLAAEADVAREHRPAEPAPSPARSLAERILVPIWQEVLERDEISVEDDYFDVGGDSIRAIVIVAKAEAAGVRISTRDLLEARTIRSLAVLGQPADPAGRGAAPAETVTSADLPLTPMQQGILFHTLAAHRPVYLSQITCTLEGDLDVHAFRSAWQLVLDRHAPLRSTFHWQGQEQPVRRVSSAVSAPWEVMDLRGQSAPDQEARIGHYCAGVLRDGFDLTAAPLLRLALFRADEQRHRFVLTHHHLLLDGWSQQLVLTDVLTAYAALRAGREPLVPDRPGASAAPGPDSGSIEKSSAHWSSELGGAPRVTATSHHSPVAVVTQTLTLPPDVVTGLTACCQRIGITTALAVQAGWALVRSHLHLPSRPSRPVTVAVQDVVIGVTVSGRSAATPGLADAIGVLINTVPMRVRCARQDSLTDWLVGVHQRRLAAGEHDTDGLAEVAQWAGAPSAAALFDSIVVVENLPPLSLPGPDLGLDITDVTSAIDEGYPLVLEASRFHDGSGSAQIALTAPALTLRADPALFTSEDRRRLLDAAGAYLSTLSRAGSAVGTLTIGDLLSAIDAAVDDAAAVRRTELHTVSDRFLNTRVRQAVDGETR